MWGTDVHESTGQPTLTPGTGQSADGDQCLELVGIIAGQVLVNQVIKHRILK